MNMRHGMWGLVLVIAALAIPDARARCGTPLSVTSAGAAGSTFSATLTNPTNQTLKGYVGVMVTLADGATALASIPVTVPQGGSATARATFPVEIEQVVDTETCDMPPWGIQETSDPIIIVLPLPDDEEPGPGES